MDAGNVRGSRCVAKNKMLKMCIFAKDGDVKNSNFENAIRRSFRIEKSNQQSDCPALDAILLGTRAFKNSVAGES